jgi:hypothetical protein
MCRSTQQTKEGRKDKHKMMFGFEGGEKLLEVSRKAKHPRRGRGERIYKGKRRRRRRKKGDQKEDQKLRS